ncbi:MAG: AraC family transcriptional regulator [bacterium]|nr:AraC family transcriptional regulator [bacterium]
MTDQVSTFKLFIMIITLHGFFLSALMAIGQLIVDRKSLKNLIFFGLFIDFALFEIHTLLYEAGLLKKYIILHQLNIPAFYLLGPLLYLLARFSLEKDFSLRRFHFVHFIPPALSILAVIYVFFYHPFEEMSFLQGYFYNRVSMFIGYSGSLLFLIYILAIYAMINSSAIWKLSVMREKRPAIVIVLIFIIFSMASLTDFLAAAFNDIFYMELSILLLTAVIIILFLINFKFPEFYQVVREVVEQGKHKQKRSYIEGLDLDEIALKLDRLMIDEELFRDENISLSLLAQKLEVSQHQLSQFLNERKNKSFSVFINEYRIEKAKQLLKENKTTSIISIAFDVGFKSKSSFNAVFLKHTGQSPSGFRKE